MPHHGCAKAGPSGLKKGLAGETLRCSTMALQGGRKAGLTEDLKGGTSPYTTFTITTLQLHYGVVRVPGAYIYQYRCHSHYLLLSTCPKLFRPIQRNIFFSKQLNRLTDFMMLHGFVWLF